MDLETPSWKRRAAFTLLANLAVFFGLIQAYAVARDWALGEILDLRLALFPLLWVDVAVIVFLLLSWGFLLRSRGPMSPHGWKSWLVPDFQALARSLRPGSPLRSAALLLGTSYAIVLLLLQGIVVVDLTGAILPGGTEYPFLEAFGGPIGWGPKLVWAPNPYFGVLLRPYTVATTALLAVLGGLGLGLVAQEWKASRGRGHVRGMAGVLTGAMVVCPACVASPVSAFLFASFATGAGGAGLGLALGPLLTFTTAMLVLAVAAMWIGIAMASRRLEVPTRNPIPSEGIRNARLATWLFSLATVLAIGALLTDLSSVPAAGPPGHGGHGDVPLGAELVHSEFAVGLAVFGTMVTAAAVSLRLAGSGLSKHTIALASGLTLLYADGLVHLFAVFEHAGSPPDVAFFLVVGAAQVFTVPIAMRSKRVLWAVAIPLTAFLLALYAVTRFVPPPFELEPEPIESLGLISKALEASILIAFAAFFGRRVIPDFVRRMYRRDLAALLLFASLGTSGMVILAEAISQALPTTLALAFGLVWASGMTAAARRITWLAWGFVAVFLAGHLGYAVYYAWVSLTWPLLLCIVAASVSTVGLWLYSRIRVLPRPSLGL